MTTSATTSIKQLAVVTALGINPADWSKKHPQLVLGAAAACALASYHAEFMDQEATGPEYTVKELRVLYSNPAKNGDVEAVAEDLNLFIDWSDESYAYIVSTNKEMRDALAASGFDAYADHSLLENGEPLQIVAFDQAQVTSV